MRKISFNTVIAQAITIPLILMGSAAFAQSGSGCGGGAGCGGGGGGGGNGGQGNGGGAVAGTGFVSLSQVPLPQGNLQGIVTDSVALKQLGKALFWDMQLGSDGIVACATCHFHAGADHRKNNTLRRMGATHIGNTTAANTSVNTNQFPFHKLADPNNKNSVVTFDSADVAGSQGVPLFDFVDVNPGSAKDIGIDAADPDFTVNGLRVRAVTGRNTPTAVNAVYNLRNFFDGRANNNFNGRNPFGATDASVANSLRCGTGNSVSACGLSVAVSSAASQAVGPPGNEVEMSYRGRTWQKIGKKMLSLIPLGQQHVDSTDSLLSGLALPVKGLNKTYAQMIMSAFDPKYYGSTVVLDINGNTVGSPVGNTSEYSQMEFNFSMFFGLAVQAYEQTLISNQSPFDRFKEGVVGAMTQAQQQGFGKFSSINCAKCHSGALFTNASTTVLLAGGPGVVNRVKEADQLSSLMDAGFFNNGSRRTSDDSGLDASKVAGVPLSFTKQLKAGMNIGGLLVNPCAFSQSSPLPQNGGNNCVSPQPTERDAVSGSFKAGTLRNVEFTGPYMHNGGLATLEDIVSFYVRGGDFSNAELDVNMSPTNMNTQDRVNMVEFMKSLSDPRVAHEMAPFDHPQLCVADGAVNAAKTADATLAQDNLVEVAAVGAAGHPEVLQTFADLLAGNTSGKAHTMIPGSCSIQGLQ